jgi:lipopolysaccharide/colanic/teichoic acid biosynthesis glycosyltransferase
MISATYAEDRAGMKRVVDMVGAMLALIVCSPLLVAIALAIRVTMGSPVLFRQQRPGLHGRSFTLVKFRTMREERAAHGSQLPDALRLTRLGRFLRHTSLDELTELFNVLVGEMSLVGPRPLLPEYLPLYSVEQARRHEVRPGITGWAQVNGRNALDWRQKFAYDIWYVDNHTLRLDAKILWMSIFRVLRAEGISQAGHATADKFRGDGP